MTLTKRKTIREISRITRMRNHDVQRIIETLVEVWTDELANGGRIEIQKFLILEVQQVDRGPNAGRLTHGPARRFIHRLVVRPSKQLRARLSRLTANPD